jgi:hypothetical protein
MHHPCAILHFTHLPRRGQFALTKKRPCFVFLFLILLRCHRPPNFCTTHLGVNVCEPLYYYYGQHDRRSQFNKGQSRFSFAFWSRLCHPCNKGKRLFAVAWVPPLICCQVPEVRPHAPPLRCFHVKLTSFATRPVHPPAHLLFHSICHACSWSSPLYSMLRFFNFFLIFFFLLRCAHPRRILITDCLVPFLLLYPVHSNLQLK